jgi:hypothetical protein
VVDLRVVDHRPLGICLEKRSQSHEQPRASVLTAFAECSSVNQFVLYAIDLCRYISVIEALTRLG